MRCTHLPGDRIFKVLRGRTFSRIISLLFLTCILSTLNDCHYYKAVQTDASLPEVMQEETVPFVILHQGGQAWHLTNVAIQEDRMMALIQPLDGHEYYKTTKPAGANRFRKSSKLDQSEVLEEVHIYAAEVNVLENNRSEILFQDIEKIVLYDPATGARVASIALTTLGILATAYFITLILVLIFKSSCPFVYAFNGTDYQFTGEIYSGSIYPSLERHDYLRMRGITPVDSQYVLAISNEVMEIQHTNLAELYCVDHSSDQQVYISKYGQVCLVGEPVVPDRITNLNGMDIRDLVAEQDSFCYFGGDLRNDASLTDGIILDYSIPEGADRLRLIIRAKNSFWMEYVYARFHRLFGSNYDNYAARRASLTHTELEREMLENQLPISVYLEKEGEWEFVDYFNLAGPMAMKEDILEIPLEEMELQSGRIKMEYCSYFWEVDYTAIDWTDKQDYRLTRVSTTLAEDELGNNVTSMLTGDDRYYYVQPEVGNRAVVHFPVPPQKMEQRSIYLHSKGYYRIIRDQQGTIQLKELRDIESGGGLPQYSQELIREGRNRMFDTGNKR